MMRPATPADIPALEAFLARHAETSMFLRANLAHGVTGGADPYATRYWLAGDPVGGVVALTTQGMVLVQRPGGAGGGARAVLAGQAVTGLNGAADQVQALSAELGLDGAPAALARDEPLYRLALAELTVPPGTSRMRPAGPEDAPLLSRWRAGYMAEALNAAPGPANEATAARQIAAQTALGTLRVLEEAGAPVAMTAFNAVLPDMVQVGGVWTPPAHRGRGHARRLVALHLAEAAAQGVSRAILFASGPPAMRAYEAVGFRRIGAYRLVLFDAPNTVAAS
ncbi:GNAT family N-acetyltransferase [Frigidibacter oleivorans]|uniref:GNAT family N-acetyltransferase n=1 Tax=Frigidibacter oleivorans TaxID=2487129 RepID=UPI000F8F1BED|nr:GNAT family N-acetyltransferase [Frigidibacter oleivorans]